LAVLKTFFLVVKIEIYHKNVTEKRKGTFSNLADEIISGSADLETSFESGIECIFKALMFYIKNIIIILCLERKFCSYLN
jgi:hypothetical protein